MDSGYFEIGSGDFDLARIEQVLASADRPDCQDYSRLLIEESNQAKSARDMKSATVFELLARTAALTLRIDASGGPFWQLADPIRDIGKLIPYFDHYLAVLEEVALLVTDPELRARITDLVSSRNRRLDHRIVKEALDAYLDSAKRLEDPENWIEYRDRMARAMQLAQRLGKGTGHVARVAMEIMAILDKYNGLDPHFASAELLRILLDSGQTILPKYGVQASKAAQRAEQENQWFRARRYWQLASECYAACKDLKNRRSCQVSFAETYVGEANDSLAGQMTRRIVAPHFIAQAIQAYRAIQDSSKDESIQKRVDDLHKWLLQIQEQTVKELPTTSFPVDVKELVTAAIDQVKGKALMDALYTLAFIHKPMSFADVRAQAEQLEQQAPLLSRMSTTILTESGRVAARRPGISQTDEDEAEKALRGEMFNISSLLRSLVVQAVIEPSRRQIELEHNALVEDFLMLVSNNPFVQSGQEMLYARGLHAGYVGDFPLAAQFLIPQLENSIRFVLTQHEVITSGLDANGIQDAYLLQRLLYQPEMKKTFGVDLTFDLQGLLNERADSNLRNLVAHGLVSYGGFFHPAFVYLWWLALKLCLTSCFVVLREEIGSGSDMSAEIDQNAEISGVPDSNDAATTNKN